MITITRDFSKTGKRCDSCATRPRYIFYVAIETEAIAPRNTVIQLCHACLYISAVRQSLAWKAYRVECCAQPTAIAPVVEQDDDLKLQREDGHPTVQE